MSSYFAIYNQKIPNTTDKHIIAICITESQAFECYTYLLNNGMRMKFEYISLERIDTNILGIIVGRIILAENWVYPR